MSRDVGGLPRVTWRDVGAMAGALAIAMMTDDVAAIG